MKANTVRQTERYKVAVIGAAISLLAIAGCTTEDSGQEVASLLGDLARQLLTFWIL